MRTASTLAALVLACALAACTGGGATGEDDAPPSPGVEALDFRAPLVGGGTYDGAGHDGRDVALWFWAPW